MSIGKKDDNAGIPEHLQGKARQDWIKRALGRPVESKNLGEGSSTPTVEKALQKKTTNPQEQTYPGKPRHFQ